MDLTLPLIHKFVIDVFYCPVSLYHCRHLTYVFVIIRSYANTYYVGAFYSAFLASTFYIDSLCQHEVAKI